MPRCTCPCSCSVADEKDVNLDLSTRSLEPPRDLSYDLETSSSSRAVLRRLETSTCACKRRSEQLVDNLFWRHLKTRDIISSCLRQLDSIGKKSASNKDEMSLSSDGKKSKKRKSGSHKSSECNIGFYNHKANSPTVHNRLCCSYLELKL